MEPSFSTASSSGENDVTTRGVETAGGAPGAPHPWGATEKASTTANNKDLVFMTTSLFKWSTAKHRRDARHLSEQWAYHFAAFVAAEVIIFGFGILQQRRTPRRAYSGCF
jgi:hypothetical protein